MNAWQSIDESLFRFLNAKVANPVFDVLMPFLSGNKLFVPAVVIVVLAMLWRGGTKGRVYVLMVAILLGLGDPLVCNQLKHHFQRVRPVAALADVRQPESYKKPSPKKDAAVAPKPGVPRRGSYSFPSAHAFNWGAIAMLTAIYYRRSWRFMVPLALAVAYSRIYNGVHYPSDVAAGLLIGATYSLLGVILLNALWNWLGKKLFPIWQARLPNLALPQLEPAVHPVPEQLDRQWIRLGYLVIAVTYVARLFYIASGTIQLSEDEAYQWLWSKHLALSYYSKPFGIALAQWVGTHIWGDTELGVRFLSPTLAGILSCLLLRFLAAHSTGRTAFMFLPVCLATPLLAGGSILMMIDPLAVFFWTLAMLAAWRAISQNSTGWWLAAGTGMGCSFLCKYISPFQWASFALFFVLCKSARPQLRRPGPWLALGINLLATLPVILWNQQNGWITLTHLKERGSMEKVWQPTLKYFLEFVGGQLGLLNIVFAIAILWAVIRFLRQDFKRRDEEPALRLELFLLCQGIVVMGFYTLYTFHSRVQLNWAAASVMPLFLFAMLWWHRRWKAGSRAPARFLSIGLGLGLPLIVFAHNTDLIEKFFGKPLPGRIDLLHRLRGYDEMARIVGEARNKLQGEGPPVFIIADHYSRAGVLSFYLPEARPFVGGDSLIKMRRTEAPHNAIWFWPGYALTNRAGENAIYICESDDIKPAPQWLVDEFNSVTDLGLFDINYRGRNYDRIQLFACRGKK